MLFFSIFYISIILNELNKIKINNRLDSFHQEMYDHGKSNRLSLC
jgi:hypothetical protein